MQNDNLTAMHAVENCMGEATNLAHSHTIRRR